MPAILELTEIVITILALGYIFSGIIRKPKPLRELRKENRFFNLENIKYSMIAVAPAVVLHELAHKFIGIWLGHTAFYHMIWWGLAIGVAMRLINSRFIFFIPGAVFFCDQIVNGACQFVGSPIEISVIAFAGPATNLALFGMAALLIKFKGKELKKYLLLLHLTRVINLWLFMLNMLPIPILDGFKVYAGIYNAIL